MWFSVYDSNNSSKKDLFWLPKIQQNLNSAPLKKIEYLSKSDSLNFPTLSYSAHRI